MLLITYMYLMPQIMKDVWYLHKVPNQENPIILGCQWLRVAWNPSRQLVWASGERFPMSFNSSLLVSKLVSLSKAAVPTKRIHSWPLLQRIIIIKVIGSDSVKTLLLSLIGFVVVLSSIIPRIVLLIYYILFFFIKLKKKNQTNKPNKRTDDPTCEALNTVKCDNSPILIHFLGGSSSWLHLW